MHEVHVHTTSSGQLEEETNVESRGIAVGIAFVPFALKDHNVTALLCQSATILRETRNTVVVRKQVQKGRATSIKVDVHIHSNQSV